MEGIESKAGLVSVIIPVFNGSRYLHEALDSVFAQTYEHFEVIVVDDGSSDNSADIARSYESVRVFCQTNQGVASARNRGVLESEGEFLVFLDQDDRLKPWALEANLISLQSHKNRAFAYGLNEIINTNGETSKLYRSQRPFPDEHIYLGLLEGKAAGAICPPSVAMIRRMCLSPGAEIFDVSASPADDYDLFLTLASKYEAHCHGRTVVEYRRHQNSMGHNALLMLDRTIKVLQKHARNLDPGSEAYRAHLRGLKFWKSTWTIRLPREAYLHLRHGRLFSASRAAWTFCIQPSAYWNLAKLLFQKALAIN